MIVDFLITLANETFINIAWLPKICKINVSVAGIGCKILNTLSVYIYIYPQCFIKSCSVHAWTFR